MAKFYGKIGYATSKETTPGVWEDSITERNYSGDIIKNISKWNASSDKVNDDINVNNQISIISDPFANQNFHSMRYIEFMGSLWKITNAEVQYPRILLSVGGVYNGEQA